MALQMSKFLTLYRCRTEDGKGVVNRDIQFFESVKIVTCELIGQTAKAVRIAIASAFVEDGRKCVFALNERDRRSKRSIGGVLSVMCQPIPICAAGELGLINDPSV